MEVKSRIFLSHVPKDRKRVDPLRLKLQASGFDVIDTVDVEKDPESTGNDSPIESVDTRIANTDQMVFALTPRSANSKPCQQEVEIARRLNKRITPVVVSELKGVPVPVTLSRLNYIFFTPPVSYDMSFAALDKALMSDIERVREHARFAAMALCWEQDGRDPQQLLSGEALGRAERWLALSKHTEPAPAKIQRDFITASRQQEKGKKQRKHTALLGISVLLLMGSAYGAALLWW